MAHTVQVAVIDRVDHRLDRHVEHDSRSKNFAFTVAPPNTGQTVFHDDTAPILDQLNLGGCVGFTGADIMNMALFTPVRNIKNNHQFYQNKDGINFYSAATHADSIAGSYPPDDTGSSGLGLAKALKKLGLIDRYQHCFTWGQYLAALAAQPVAVGTLWTNDMFTPDSNGVIRVGKLTDANIAGGHEWSIRGRDAERGLNLGRNHWNKTWNKKTIRQKLPGEFWIPDNDLKELLVNQGDVTVLHGVGMP
jgi:hypothetical protein